VTHEISLWLKPPNKPFHEGSNLNSCFVVWQGLCKAVIIVKKTLQIKFFIKKAIIMIAFLFMKNIKFFVKYVKISA